MIQKGVLVGSAAALVLGVAFVAAAVVSRPHEDAPDPPPAAAKMQVTLVAPKDPTAQATGGKLETVPDGAPNASADAVVPGPPAPPPPAAGPEFTWPRTPETQAPETERPRGRAPGPRSARREPEPADDDFLNDRDEAFARRDYVEPYRERSERWRPRRYDEDRWETERDWDDRFDPVEPEPPPWWRR